MTRSRSGVSLVEMALAALVLGLALLPVLSMFSSAGRQARQTSDYGQALALAEKAGEDMRLAHWENSHYPGQLQEDPFLRSPSPVIDGVVPFFMAIEDLAPPFGRLRPPDDPGISKAFPVLRRQIERFRMRCEPRIRALPAGGAVLDVPIELEWSDFRGSASRLTQAVVLALPAVNASVPAPALEEDRTSIDAAIRDLMIPFARGRRLDDLIRAASGPPEMSRALGGIVVLARRLTARRPAYVRGVETLARAIGTETDPQRVLRSALALARFAEVEAAVHLESLVHLRDAAGVLARAVEGGTSPALAAGPLLDALATVELLRLHFESLLRQARSTYVLVARPPLVNLLPGRPRIRLLIKIIELHKLEVLLVDRPDLSSLRAMLENLKTEQEGRVTNVHAWATYELSTVCRDITSLREHYPCPERFTALQELSSTIRRGAARLAPK